MVKKSNALLDLINKRIASAGANPDLYLLDSLQIVVFGSVAAGLERRDSDIDVLCIGKRELKLKSSRLDFLAITEVQSQDARWQQSELAGHINKYGIWIKGTRPSKQFAGFSEECLEAKGRRVTAFLRRLSDVWDELDHDFRVKYSLKVRREMQRLMLLESQIAIPPTRVLDLIPPSAPERVAVSERLHKQIHHRKSAFARDFLATVAEQWNIICRDSQAHRINRDKQYPVALEV